MYWLGNSPTSKAPKPSTTRGHKTNYPEEPRCIAVIAPPSICWHLIGWCLQMLRTCPIYPGPGMWLGYASVGWGSRPKPSAGGGQKPTMNRTGICIPGRLSCCSTMVPCMPCLLYLHRYRGMCEVEIDMIHPRRPRERRKIFPWPGCTAYNCLY